MGGNHYLQFLRSISKYCFLQQQTLAVQQQTLAVSGKTGRAHQLGN